MSSSSTRALRRSRSYRSPAAVDRAVVVATRRFGFALFEGVVPPVFPVTASRSTVSSSVSTASDASLEPAGSPPPEATRSSAQTTPPRPTDPGESAGPAPGLHSFGAALEQRPVDGRVEDPVDPIVRVAAGELLRVGLSTVSVVAGCLLKRLK